MARLRDDRPIVLVTASTAYQSDKKLISTALEAFSGEDVTLVATTAAHSPSEFRAPSNARVEQFVPHGPIIARAACVICHGGQGIDAEDRWPQACPRAWCRSAVTSSTWRAASRWRGAGVRLHHKRLTPDRLRSAVRKAVGMRAGAERVAQAFAAAGGSSAAADAIEELLPADQARVNSALRGTSASASGASS